MFESRELPPRLPLHIFLLGEPLSKNMSESPDRFDLPLQLHKSIRTILGAEGGDGGLWCLSYKPCPDRGDGRAGGSVLLDIDRAVRLLLPDRRLIVPVDNVKFNINIGVEGRRAAVGGPHADHEPLFLFLVLGLNACREPGPKMVM